MPHIILEHSEAIEEQLSMPDLLTKLHENLASHGEIPMTRIKTRSIAIKHNVVGEKSITGNMAHLTLLLLEGRSTETRHKYGSALYDLLKKEIASQLPECALTLEVREMDKDTYFL